jgi:putative ABC transport system permease protein
MESLLFGIGLADPLTLSLMAMILMMVALIASYIPARRAAELDPMAALRDQ